MRMVMGIIRLMSSGGLASSAIFSVDVSSNIALFQVTNNILYTLQAHTKNKGTNEHD
jgi:hypothetical protein